MLAVLSRPFSDEEPAILAPVTDEYAGGGSSETCNLLMS